jgi:hypothetical protein
MMLLSVCKAADRIGVSGPHYISLPAKFVTAPVRFATDWSGAKLRIQMHVPVSISPRRRASVTSGLAVRRGGKRQVSRERECGKLVRDRLKQDARVGDRCAVW